MLTPHPHCAAAAVRLCRLSVCCAAAAGAAPNAAPQGCARPGARQQGTRQGPRRPWQQGRAWRARQVSDSMRGCTHRASVELRAPVTAIALCLGSVNACSRPHTYVTSSHSPTRRGVTPEDDDYSDSEGWGAGDAGSGGGAGTAAAAAAVAAVGAPVPPKSVVESILAWRMPLSAAELAQENVRTPLVGGWLGCCALVVCMCGAAGVQRSALLPRTS
jgi:hypothetical protein